MNVTARKATLSCIFALRTCSTHTHPWHAMYHVPMICTATTQPLKGPSRSLTTREHMPLVARTLY